MAFRTQLEHGLLKQIWLFTAVPDVAASAIAGGRRTVSDFVSEETRVAGTAVGLNVLVRGHALRFVVAFVALALAEGNMNGSELGFRQNQGGR